MVYPVLHINHLFLLLGITLLGIALCFTRVDSAKAETVAQPEIAVDFDLSKPVSQQKTVTLENGATAVIGARYISDPISPAWDSYYQNASGDWEIYYNSPIIYRHFYITISNHKITRAHSYSYTTFLCSASSESFTWNSTNATYRLGIDVFGGGSTVAVLQALMEGSTLHTYAKYITRFLGGCVSVHLGLLSSCLNLI